MRLAGRMGTTPRDSRRGTGLRVLLEQIEIVKRVESLFRLVANIEGRVELSRKRVQCSTQSFLAKAFVGNSSPPRLNWLDARGREYEPASVLLERIRKERESQATSKPERKRTGTKNKTTVAL